MTPASIPRMESTDRVLGLYFILTLWTGIPLQGQDLDTADVQVKLDSALHLAQRTAASAFPDLSDYLLYSVTPRVFKGDPRGLHWQVSWQERVFPHRRLLFVRVYMKDGHTTAERLPAGAEPGPGRDPSGADGAP